MRFACWITKVTDTHSENVVVIVFPRQQWLRERASMLRLYANCMPCCYLCVSFSSSVDESIGISSMHTDSSKQRVAWSCQNACPHAARVLSVPLHMFKHVTYCLSWLCSLLQWTPTLRATCHMMWWYGVREGRPNSYFMVVVVCYGDSLQHKIKEFFTLKYGYSFFYVCSTVHHSIELFH